MVSSSSSVPTALPRGEMDGAPESEFLAPKDPSETATPLLGRTSHPSNVGEETGELILGFETPDGAFKEVKFRYRPLGLKHSNSVPVTVIDVSLGSPAAELGVQPGWRIKHIANEDMSGRDFLYVFQSIFKKASALRHRGSGLKN